MLLILQILFEMRAVLKSGENSLDISQVFLGHIKSSDAFRPIVCERKHLMDYKEITGRN